MGTSASSKYPDILRSVLILAVLQDQTVSLGLIILTSRSADFNVWLARLTLKLILVTEIGDIRGCGRKAEIVVTVRTPARGTLTDFRPDVRLNGEADEVKRPVP